MTPDANALDVERLREIAGKATQGKWPEATWYGSMDGGFAAIGPHHLTPDGESDEPGGVAETLALADARYIATFNPSTALSLLSRLDALEAEVVKLRVVAEKADALVTADPTRAGFYTFRGLQSDAAALRRALAALAPSDSSADARASSIPGAASEIDLAKGQSSEGAQPPGIS